MLLGLPHQLLLLLLVRVRRMLLLQRLLVQRRLRVLPKLLLLLLPHHLHLRLLLLLSLRPASLLGHVLEQLLLLRQMHHVLQLLLSEARQGACQVKTWGANRSSCRQCSLCRQDFHDTAGAGCNQSSLSCCKRRVRVTGGIQRTAICGQHGSSTHAW